MDPTGAVTTSSFGASPQQRAGAEFGLEGLPWEDAATARHFALEVRGRLELRTFGLAQTEIWEPLSGASTSCSTTPAPARRPSSWKT